MYHYFVAEDVSDGDAEFRHELAHFIRAMPGTGVEACDGSRPAHDRSISAPDSYHFLPSLYHYYAEAISRR